MLKLDYNDCHTIKIKSYKIQNGHIENCFCLHIGTTVSNSNYILYNNTELHVINII